MTAGDDRGSLASALLLQMGRLRPREVWRLMGCHSEGEPRLGPRTPSAKPCGCQAEMGDLKKLPGGAGFEVSLGGRVGMRAAREGRRGSAARPRVLWSSCSKQTRCESGMVPQLSRCHHLRGPEKAFLLPSHSLCRHWQDFFLAHTDWRGSKFRRFASFVFMLRGTRGSRLEVRGQT